TGPRRHWRDPVTRRTDYSALPRRLNRRVRRHRARRNRKESRMTIQVASPARGSKKLNQRVACFFRPFLENPMASLLQYDDCDIISDQLHLFGEDRKSVV